MRIHRGTNWTTFSAGDETSTIEILTRRMFHPTRGEEAQLEITMRNRKNGARGKKPGTVLRWHTTVGRARMTPDEAKAFCTVMLGRYKEAVEVPTLGPLRVETVQSYQPIEYANKMTPREAAIAKAAFLDGYDYCKSQGDTAPATKP